jgi:acetylornithine deacetylase
MLNHENILARLVGFDTTSHRSNRVCIDFIRDYLNGFGIASTIIASDDGAKACLWATLGPVEEQGIVLAGHTDVVPVAGQNWTSDPFILVERDGKFFGRGACDMKAFIACVLAIVPGLIERKLQRPVHFAFTHDEETDMSGALRLTDYMKTQGIMPLWTWIGEPTELRLIDSHKGVAMLETRITGVPGHSGQPDKGLNAIDCGAQFIGILQRVAQNRRDKPWARSRFDPPYTTFNSGIVEGGTAENIIAEHFRLLWQVRLHPGEELSTALAEIDHMASTEIKPRFKAFVPHAGMSTCTCFDIPPLLPTPSNPGSDILKRLTGRRETEAVSFATEGGFFQKLDAPVIICGPGSIEQAHKADEFVSREQLVACVRLLERTLAETTGPSKA